MRYKIFENGEEINTIVADEEFVAAYCEENGFSYQAEPLPVPEPEPELTTEQRVTELEEALELLLSGATEDTEVTEGD